jgi:hypothetical protein
MNVKLLMLPLFLTGALLMGCDDRSASKSPDASTNAKAAADKAAANAVRDQASKLLADLQTAVTAQKWTDAGALVKQLDAVRDRLAADQKASFDSLKKQYDDNKR